MMKGRRDEQDFGTTGARGDYGLQKRTETVPG
jgi:hypothetical protein